MIRVDISPIIEKYDIAIARLLFTFVANLLPKICPIRLAIIAINKIKNGVEIAGIISFENIIATVRLVIVFSTVAILRLSNTLNPKIT